MSLFLLPPALRGSGPTIMLAADLLLAGKQQVHVPAEHHPIPAQVRRPIIAWTTTDGRPPSGDFRPAKVVWITSLTTVSTRRALGNDGSHGPSRTVSIGSLNHRLIHPLDDGLPL